MRRSRRERIRHFSVGARVMQTGHYASMAEGGPSKVSESDSPGVAAFLPAAAMICVLAAAVTGAASAAADSMALLIVTASVLLIAAVLMLIFAVASERSGRQSKRAHDTRSTCPPTRVRNSDLGDRKVPIPAELIRQYELVADGRQRSWLRAPWWRPGFPAAAFAAASVAIAAGVLGVGLFAGWPDVLMFFAAGAVLFGMAVRAWRLWRRSWHLIERSVPILS
jgi:hypothetical protein